ncbi:hypothetical protein ACOSQ2_004455 [Xanthoceras sorbifolium]
MGHRRFLPVDHKWQKQRRQFDAKKKNKVAPKQPSSDDYYLFKMMHFYLECVLDSSVGKRKGRGKAKGIAISHGLEITFTEYPEEEFEILFARFKEAQITYTCSEDELKDAFYKVVKNGYSRWMFQLRLPVFRKYISAEYRMAHCPYKIPPPVWNEMVRKWMKKEWQDNSKAVDMYHTTGSIPMAKYKSEEMEKTGKEPSPIECFKKFHVRKHSTKVWTHKKAKQLYVCITLQICKTVNFLETVGKPSHGHILGLGVGVKAKDIYGSSSDESSKRARVDKQEELELNIKRLISSMISNLDTQRPPATANISSNADVEQSIHVDEE